MYMNRLRHWAMLLGILVLAFLAGTGAATIVNICKAKYAEWTAPHYKSVDLIPTGAEVYDT